MTGGSRRRRAFRHGASALAVVGMAAGAACYSTGDGTPPPLQDFYFPVGLVVSPGGNVLYVANSDFDLQWNGGTVQAYDLNAVRLDTARLISQQVNPNHAPDPGHPLPYAVASAASLAEICPSPPQAPPDGPAPNPGTGTGRVPIGQTCVPPMNARSYWRSSVTIGAFATDILLAKSGDRLFVPVRGDASLTYLDIVNDSTFAPPFGGDATNPRADTADTYAPFQLDCGATANGGRCNDVHEVGNNPDQRNNSRHITMPGEPFGITQTDDGQAIVITHQTDTKTSLFLTGIVQTVDPQASAPTYTRYEVPSLQFVLDGVPTGGVGIIGIPHDPDAVGAGEVAPLPAFLETTRAANQLSILRYHSDEGYVGIPVVNAEGGIEAGVDGVGVWLGSSIVRPYLIKEQAVPITANASGVDSRGIAIDPTPRIACKEAVLAQGQSKTSDAYLACARLPARVFIANRSPPSLLLGEVGEPSTAAGTYDADHLAIFGNLPLQNGPSNVYLAPIVDAQGRYALRVFIVCFDAQTIFVYDPDAQRIENIIRMGPGPFRMAFDPFDWKDVATHALVQQDPRNNVLSDGSNPQSALVDLKKYRFAYVASFTDSFVQVIDLDQSIVYPGGQSTFENNVFTLGTPTQPKGAK